jgi:hypothetical protein
LRLGTEPGGLRIFHLAFLLVFALVLGNGWAAAHQDDEQKKEVFEGDSHGDSGQLQFPAVFHKKTSPSPCRISIHIHARIWGNSTDKGKSPHSTPLKKGRFS